MGEALLVVDAVGKTYTSDGAQVTAVGEVSFTVGSGEFVAVVGPSGCGKTTLLRCVAGLLAPDSGSITYAGAPVARRVPEGLGVVFQEYNRSLFPWLSVDRNVEYGLTHLPRRERRERAEEALHRVGLGDVGERYPWQLSGGMQQRVAIARALATHPRMLLMDEPFASVDAQTRIDLEEMTATISAELGLTTLLITHDIDEAIFLSDRVVVLSSRPSTVVREVVVDIPRPREELATKAGAEFQSCRRAVHELIVTPKRAQKTTAGVV